MATDPEADAVVADPDEGATTAPWGRRLQFWRSPEGQPGWARPALLIVTVLAGLAYGWRIGSTIEIYYGAAVRSMAHSWHNFAYGALDPAGTMTLDKLPGALWVQALSVKLFGFNVWSQILPQAVEGALTVLVLYHAVRRLAGPLAAIGAAVVLAISPATVTLNRGNIPDTLMILLLVLAADSTVTAVRTGRWRSIVMAGVWTALAFEAKMLEAWLILPALGLVYLIAGREKIWPRLGKIVVLGLVVLVVSMSYLVFVQLTPASSRPHVDGGGASNSVFHMVFSYNGVGRVGQTPPNVEAERTLATPLFGQVESPTSPTRLLKGGYGRDIGWLLPAATIAGVAVLVARRRERRTDLVRTAAVLFLTWLVVFAVMLSFAKAINAYYTAALSPPVAGLLGVGGAMVWAYRRRPAAVLTAAGTVLVTVVYAAVLLPKSGTGVLPWLRYLVILLGLVAAAVLCWSAWRDWQPSTSASRSGGHVSRRTRTKATNTATVGCVLGAVAIVLAPVAASVSVVVETLGPFDSAFQSNSGTAYIKDHFDPQTSPAGLAALQALRGGSPYLAAAQTSIVASPYIYATGEETVPLGGYTGVEPSPTVAAVRAMVAAGDFHPVLIATPSASAASAYLAQHCRPAAVPAGTRFAWTSTLKLYVCTP